MARWVVEDYWTPDTDVPAGDPDGVPVRTLDPVVSTFRMPLTAKTYRRCVEVVQNRKGELTRCEEPALVPWAQRDNPKGKCKRHGGAS